MKIFATVTLLLALALGGLGYVEYKQTQVINALNLQMSALAQEVDTQHRALASHKKAILGLRSDQKQADKILLGLLLFLKAQESEPSPKSEQNRYTTNSQLRIQ